MEDQICFNYLGSYHMAETAQSLLAHERGDTQKNTTISSMQAWHLFKILFL